MSLRVEPGMRTVVPFDDQGCEALLRSAHMVGNDRDGIIEAHDLTHAFDRPGRRIIHALHATAEHGRLRERRDLHARRPHIDAVHGRAVDLRRRVQPLGRRADELEILRPLQCHLVRDRNPGGVGGKLAIGEASLGWDMKHRPALRAAGCRVDVPSLRRGRDEHRPRGRAGLAKRLPCGADGVGVAGRLQAAEQRVAVAFWVRRRMLQPHLRQVHLELFGDQHRDGGVGALTHFDIGHGQDDLAIRSDPDERVGSEAVIRCFGIAAGNRQVETEHQSPACGCSSPEESAPRETVC